MAIAHGEKLLKYLEEHGKASSLELSELWNEDHQKIVGTVKSLLCLGDVRTCISLFIIFFFFIHMYNETLEYNLYTSMDTLSLIH